MLCLGKQTASDQPSSVQVRKANSNSTAPPPRPSVPEPARPAPAPAPDHAPSASASVLELHRRAESPDQAFPGSPVRLADAGRSTSNLAISGSHPHLAHKESTPSIASDLSMPFATQELQQRLRQLQK